MRQRNQIRNVRPMRAAGSVSAILALWAALYPALAEAASSARTRQLAASPPKDCTRFNGRFGYYANPWCSPAEQERWDRWEAARAKLR
ncbi:hypothetical protein [Hyphomicrobium sp. LHD-15]|uniref:hypothetical protein n=1 Tax=Hyphomicrobium sp. LHD-15 TaxID=3072142 RepID=UPI00280D2A4D|nr:hypothetical protein [Hyphomicrobium sp. LHD-15]MDQ8700289.1 hypothetical protein [Hyphomicrobium sp. LHD-15]